MEYLLHNPCTKPDVLTSCKDLVFFEISFQIYVLAIWLISRDHAKSSIKLPFLKIFNMSRVQVINTLGPRQTGRTFADDIFKCIFLNENVWIAIKISLNFVPKGSINNIPALVQIMAWRRPGDKPLSKARMFNLPTHICVTRPQWVKVHNTVPVSMLSLPSLLALHIRLTVISLVQNQIW